MGFAEARSRTVVRFVWGCMRVTNKIGDNARQFLCRSGADSREVRLAIAGKASDMCESALRDVRGSG